MAASYWARALQVLDAKRRFNYDPPTNLPDLPPPPQLRRPPPSQLSLSDAQESPKPKVEQWSSVAALAKGALSRRALNKANAQDGKLKSIGGGR